MTEKQEIRAKAIELAIQFIGMGRPFKPMNGALSNEDIDMVMQAIKLFTNRFELLILKTSDQQQEAV
jgi:hypothetical protein